MLLMIANLPLFTFLFNSFLNHSLRINIPRIESRWGSRFSAPVQTGPGANPASWTMGTGSFPRVKWPVAWRWPPTSRAEVEEIVEIHLYSPLWAFVAYSGATFMFKLTCLILNFLLSVRSCLLLRETSVLVNLDILTTVLPMKTLHIKHTFYSYL
jgi:hypothetical protein